MKEDFYLNALPKNHWIIDSVFSTDFRTNQLECCFLLEWKTTSIIYRSVEVNIGDALRFLYKKIFKLNLCFFFAGGLKIQFVVLFDDLAFAYKNVYITCVFKFYHMLFKPIYIISDILFLFLTPIYVMFKNLTYFNFRRFRKSKISFVILYFI